MKIARRSFVGRGFLCYRSATGGTLLSKAKGMWMSRAIRSPLCEYRSDFPFVLETTLVGDSEMQHLDRAYAMSLVRHFMSDDSLVLTICDAFGQEVHAAV